MIKSTPRGPAVCKRVVYRFYIFCLTTAQAMNPLIIAFVVLRGMEEWSTVTTVTETNYKAADLIPISLVESSNFSCRLYHKDKILSEV